jgi:hypothetical protein
VAEPAAVTIEAPLLAGKGKRVAGVFVLMIGAGAIVDRHALWTGIVVMLLGAAAFVWGMLAARSRGETRAPLAEAQATESTG